MAKSRSSVMPRIFAELSVIIVGVLIAFQVESWRDGQEARSRERVQLAAIRADFAANQERLGRVITQQEELLAAQQALLGILHGGARPSADSLRTLVERTRRFHRLEPVTGAYDALVASGDLRLIRDQELRSELATFVGEAGDGYEDEELSMLFRAELVSAAVSSSEYLSLMPPERRAQFELPMSRYTADFDALIQNPRYASYLALVQILETTQLGYFRRLQRSADAIMERLAEQVR